MRKFGEEKYPRAVIEVGDFILWEQGNKVQYVIMTIARDQKFRKMNHFLVILARAACRNNPNWLR